MRARLAAASALACALLPGARGQHCGNASFVLGFHSPVCDGAGNLLPPAAFGSLQAAADASVRYYAASPRGLPLAHGLPPYVWATFTAGFYLPTSLDIIAAMQDGMGLLGYAKYLARARAGRGGNASAAAAGVADLAEYMLAWAVTNASSAWAWPGVVRSTGLNIEWPLSTAAQSDVLSGIDCIETDKVGLVGWALYFAANVTGNATYRAAALHHARVLARWQGAGNSTDAPWPFRVDARTGAFLSGHKNGALVPEDTAEVVAARDLHHQALSLAAREEQEREVALTIDEDAEAKQFGFLAGLGLKLACRAGNCKAHCKKVICKACPGC